MANDEKSYDRARDLTEKALDAYVEGDEKQGGKLVEEAKAVDQRAVRDVGKDLEEDASSEHDLKKLDEKLAEKGSDPA